MVRIRGGWMKIRRTAAVGIAGGMFALCACSGNQVSSSTNWYKDGYNWAVGNSKEQGYPNMVGYSAEQYCSGKITGVDPFGDAVPSGAAAGVSPAPTGNGEESQWINGCVAGEKAANPNN